MVDIEIQIVVFYQAFELHSFNFSVSSFPNGIGLTSRGGLDR